MVDTITPQVVFEDDDILVVNKPGGLVCHSAQRPGLTSLAEWLRDYGVQTPRMINRLDRETSGLVLVAKNERAASVLGRAVLQREIEKQYLAICHGWFAQPRGVIDQPIATDETATVYTKRVVNQSGKASVTEFEIVRQLGSSEVTGFSLVRLQPRTGRAHQLRVHLSSLGHPIIGDKIYGPDERLYLRFIEQGVTGDMLEKLLLPRHALHAEQLVIRHPRTGARSEFCAPMPADMQVFIEEHR